MQSVKWLAKTIVLVPLIGVAVSYAQKPYEGETINVLLLQQNTFELLEEFSADFEEKTGIEVNYDVLPESGLIPRLQISLASQTGEYDVVTANTRLLGPMVSGGWIQPISSFIDDAEDDWDFQDIIPRLVESLTVDGETYGLPYATETNILYYNKSMFEEAGLEGPPKNKEELMAYAEQLYKPEQDQAGIVMRGTRESADNSYAWIMLWKLFGGDWYAESEVPFAVLDRPEAIEAASYYTDLLMNYGPSGITSYGWQEALLAFQQGRVAMFMDASPFSPQIEDPEASDVAGDVGYAVVEGEGDDFTVGPVWGFYMADTVSGDKQAAAWEWMKWATSKEAMLRGVEAGVYSNPTRSSVLQSEAFAEQFNPDWAEVLDAALNFSDPQYTPLVAEGSQIRDILAIALSEIMSGQQSAEQAMQSANQQVRELMQ